MRSGQFHYCLCRRLHGGGLEAGMKELYRIIDRLDKNKEHELITVTGGKHAGAEILLTEGSIVWSSAADPERVIEESEDGALFREKLTHVTDLVVCGCGYVGLAVIKLGKFLGWHVTALDDRDEFTSRAVQCGADEAVCAPFSESLERYRSDGGTCFVVVTRDHDHDKDCLRIIMDKPWGYVGTMGSRLRARRLREYLQKTGFDEEKISRIHAPVGLPIGADTPEEIAVSVIGEIIREKTAFRGGSVITDDLGCALRELCASDGHAVIAAVTARKGSTPREPGARMLVYPDGRTVGTIGGGSMEGEVISEAVRLLKDPASFRPRLMSIDLTGSQGAEDEMICGGMNEVFLQLL